DYLYLECIDFILKVKTGVFAEHSPLLNDISGVPDWTKVKNGLHKMYQDGMSAIIVCLHFIVFVKKKKKKNENYVFKKFPVIQHFFFGSLLAIDLKPATKTEVNEDEVLERKKALIAKLNAQRGITDRDKTGKPVDNKGKGYVEPPLEITGVAPWARPDAVDLVYDSKSPWKGDHNMDPENLSEDEPINMPLPLNPTKKGPPEHGSLKDLRTKSPVTSPIDQLEEQQDKEKEKDKETDTAHEESSHT
ncbi:hypothetical protein RFI_27035, partial [Reticulomyxa filosa]